MRYFLKSCKNRHSVGGSTSNLPLASGVVIPRCYSHLALLLSPIITTFSAHVSDRR